MPKEHLLEIRIVQPGSITARYYPVDADTLRLEAVLHPEESLPFDVGMLPTALTPYQEPFTVLVLGRPSHPPGTVMRVRLLGALQRAEEPPFLLAVPAVDARAPSHLEALPETQRAAILRALQRARPGDWRWLTTAESETHLHTGARRYHTRQERYGSAARDPSWRPPRLDRLSPSFAEAERYTPAEYTFYDLPYRFQRYVSESLLPDERVLYAVRRPAMSGARKRSFLRRERLQAGVVILTTRRLIHLAEHIPPDSANVRYGFHQQVGVVERLADVELLSRGENLLLRTRWDADGGQVLLEWEMPPYTRAALQDLTKVLRNFLVTAEDCALRRAGLPTPPEALPPLRDTAANDPAQEELCTQKHRALLKAALHPGERALAWALLPSWFRKTGEERVLVVTGQRVVVLPAARPDIPLSRIAALEYSNSIIQSYLALHFVTPAGHPGRHLIHFPYPAEAAFRACFEVLERSMAVVPLTKVQYP